MGFKGGFYQHYWSICGELVFKVVSIFFEFGCLPSSWDNTFIVLIPKRKNAYTLSDYRPISLCNFSYKIILKIITTRMQRLMSYLISSSQAAFVKGRSASQKISLANEVMHSFRKKKGSRGWAMVMIDFNKAYDRLEWGFVCELLAKFGLPAKFINWIKLYFSNVSYQVLVNGVPFSTIKLTRGLR